MTKFYSIGHYKGAPIKLHWTFGLALLVVYLSSHEYTLQRRIIATLCLVLPYLFLILVHEMGHAYVAHRRGLRVFGLEIYPVHGRCIYEMPHYEIDHILVAWGGVMAQAIVLLPALAARQLLDLLPYGIKHYASSVVSFMVVINLVSIVFNLLPFEGLDGRIAWRIVPLQYKKLKQRWSARRARTGLKVVASKISPAKAEELANEEIRKIMTKDQPK